VIPLDSCLLPETYVVRKGAPEVQALLKAHGVRTEQVTAPLEVRAEEYDLYPIRLMFIEEESLSVPVAWRREVQAKLEPGDLLVPVDQEAGLLVATMLEPASAWGLLKYPSFRSLASTRPYPILRIPVTTPTNRRGVPRATTPRTP
jgi:hypothetical protein